MIAFIDRPLCQSVELCDLEELADDVYRLAGVDPSESESPIEIARHVLGGDAIRVVPRRELTFARAALIPFGRTWRIFIRDDLPYSEVAHSVGHELGHLFFKRLQCQIADEEEAANRFGAMLVAPRLAFQRAVKLLGPSPHKLARAFSTTQSSIFLRRGEVQGTTVVLARPERIYVRGWYRPPIKAVEMWLKRGGPGVIKIPITDAPKRSAIVLVR